MPFKLSIIKRPLATYDLGLHFNTLVSSFPDSKAEFSFFLIAYFSTQSSKDPDYYTQNFFWPIPCVPLSKFPSLKANPLSFSHHLLPSSPCDVATLPLALAFHLNTQPSC